MKNSVRILAVLAMIAILAAMVPAMAAEPDQLSEEDMKEREMTVTADCVNMRGGYTGTAGHKEIINWSSGLMKGETVYCIQQHGNWYYVCRKKLVDGVHQCGWVWGDYLKFKNGAKSVSDGDKAKGSSSYVGGTPASEATKQKLRETAGAKKVIEALGK